MLNEDALSSLAPTGKFSALWKWRLRRFTTAQLLLVEFSQLAKVQSANEQHVRGAKEQISVAAPY